MFQTFKTDNKIEKIEDLKNSFILGDRVESLRKIPDNSISFIFTSPPYNVEKNYNNHNDDMELDEYLSFLYDTWKECFRTLKDGGRMVINVPFSITKYKNKVKKLIPINSIILLQMEEIGFTYRNDIVWNKDNVTSRTAWGSFKSPSSPYVVGPYELLLIFHKNNKVLSGNKEDIDITKEEFIKFSFGMWNIMPETTKHKNHPAPFPKELVYRLIKFYTYKNDIILDPFSGTGTVAEVCKNNGRNFIYIDNCEDYLNYAKEEIDKIKEIKEKKIIKQNYDSLKKFILNKIKEKDYDKSKIELIFNEIKEEILNEKDFSKHESVFGKTSDGLKEKI